MANINCKCDMTFTCGYCLNNVVYFFTPSTNTERLERTLNRKDEGETKIDTERLFNLTGIDLR